MDGGAWCRLLSMGSQRVRHDWVISLNNMLRLKHLPGMPETRVRSLGWEDSLEKEMATHSSILAWRIPWREEPGRLQSMGLQRVRHNWVTSLFQSLNRVACHSLLQGIFPTQGSNPHPLHCRLILYCWATRETPLKHMLSFYFRCCHIFVFGTLCFVWLRKNLKHLIHVWGLKNKY